MNKRTNTSAIKIFDEDGDENSILEADICVHIFTGSATMVGVCLAVIGIINVALNVRKGGTIADDLLAFDSFIFLVACFLSYWALRTRGKYRMHRIEKVADLFFIFGLFVMVLVSGIITWSVL